MLTDEQMRKLGVEELDTAEYLNQTRLAKPI